MKFLIFVADAIIPKPLATSASMYHRWISTQMSQAFDEYLKRKGVGFDFATGGDLFEVADMIRNGNYDGFCHLYSSGKNEEQECLRKLATEIPTLSFGSGWREDGLPYVGIDNRESIRILLKNLESEGFERLAYCGPAVPRSVTATERQNSFIEEMNLRGKDVPPHFVIETENSREEGVLEPRMVEQLDNLFRYPNPPDAIVCFNDFYAADIIEYARLRKISIPETLGVTGIDGWFSEGTLPISLTTVAYNFPLMVRSACQYLIELVTGTSAKRLKKTGAWVLIPPTFIQGNTSRKRSMEVAEADLRFLRQVYNFTQQNLHLPDPVAEIAERLEIGRAHFRRKFAALNGDNYLHYLQQVRLERAAELLSGTDEPVLDISSACGFKSISCFHTLFRKRYGCTPKGYRNKE